MSDTPTCNGCGAPLSPGAHFCKACGAPRVAHPASPNDPPTQSYSQSAPSYAQPAPQATYPQSPDPAAGASRSSWLIVTAASGAIALVAVAITVLVLATKGAGNDVSAATAPTLTAPGAASSGESREDGGTSASASSSAQANQAGGGTGTAGPPDLVSYTGATISARIPNGWKTVENEAHKPGYVESKWRDPANADDTVLIDTSPSTTDTLEQDAAPVHEALTKESGYQEIFYGSSNLAGVPSWKWVFRVEGDQRVDYFFNHCASGYAMLGSAPPNRFARLEATFKAVASSVRPSAEPQC